MHKLPLTLAMLLAGVSAAAQNGPPNPFARPTQQQPQPPAPVMPPPGVSVGPGMPGMPPGNGWDPYGPGGPGYTGEQASGVVEEVRVKKIGTVNGIAVLKATDASTYLFEKEKNLQHTKKAVLGPEKSAAGPEELGGQPPNDGFTPRQARHR